MLTDPVHRSPALRSVARRATLGRSLGLLRSFPLEQSDPDAFYSGLARDTVELVADLWEGSGSVGGGGENREDSGADHRTDADRDGVGEAQTTFECGGGHGGSG